MNGYTVYIHSGANSGTHGLIQGSEYNHDTHTMNYKIIVHGYYDNDYGYEVPDRIFWTAAANTAIYFDTNAWVQLKSNNYRARVLKRNWVDNNFTYDIMIPESEFPTHPMDYLPHDTYLTVRGSDLYP
jgi:hypothetical protein